MQRLAKLTVVAVVLAGTAGCQCCDSLMRFEAWKNYQLFGIGGGGCGCGCGPCGNACTPGCFGGWGSPTYGADCCQPVDDCCQPAQDCCDPCGGSPGATYQSLPGTFAPGVQPGPETYTPSL